MFSDLSTLVIFEKYKVCVTAEMFFENIKEILVRYITHVNRFTDYTQFSYTTLNF